MRILINIASGMSALFSGMVAVVRNWPAPEGSCLDP
jgi:hypothetical protein